jgi:hypothetical protein
MIVEEEAFENLGSFIEALQDERLHLNLKGLQVRGYIYSFVSMYKPSALFDDIAYTFADVYNWPIPVAFYVNMQEKMKVFLFNL